MGDKAQWRREGISKGCEDKTGRGRKRRTDGESQTESVTVRYFGGETKTGLRDRARETETDRQNEQERYMTPLALTMALHVVPSLAGEPLE